MHMHTMSSTLRSFMPRALLSTAAAAALMCACAVMAPQAMAQDFTQTPDTGSAAMASAPAIDQSTEAPQLPQLGEGMLVSVNNDMITSYDLKQRMLLLIVTSGVQVTQDNYQAFQQQAINSLVDERLQNQELEHWKVKVSDAEVDEEVARMAQQSNLTADQLLGELKKAGIEPATLRAQIRAETGWSQLVGGRYHANANVGKAQVEATMDKVIADGQKPQYLVAEIFLDAATAGSMANAQKGAQQLYTQIAQGVAPFQAVARQFSNSASAAQGGDAGWLVSGNIDPAIEAALQRVKAGEMTAPITTKDGVYIYLVRQKSDGNADMVMHLKQAAITLPANASAADVSNAQTSLLNFRSRNPTCEALDEVKASSSIRVTDLGETELSTLLPTYADALRPLKDDQSSPALRNSQSMTVVYVCERRLAGENALTREQIESQLVNQRLSMLGKRYLRELRSVATIENH